MIFDIVMYFRRISFIDMAPNGYCYIGYKFKYRKISLAFKLLLSCPISLNVCTEHGSNTAVLCAKFQNDLITKMDALDERDLARFECKLSLRQNLPPPPGLYDLSIVVGLSMSCDPTMICRSVVHQIPRVVLCTITDCLAPHRLILERK